MVENYYLSCRVWAMGAWLLVVALLGAAWVTTAVGDDHIGDLLAYTGLALSAAAATLHIRSYIVQNQMLLRAVLEQIGEPMPEKGQIRSLR